MDVDIIVFAATQVAVLEHTGSPESLDASIARFVAWRKRTGLSPVKTCATYGIAYNDPRTVAPEAFRFDICGVVERPVPDNVDGIVNKMIPAGRCARIRHIGSHADMDNTLNALYGVWLPQSGEALRDFPRFFHYKSVFPAVPEAEWITDIYVPLQ